MSRAVPHCPAAPALSPLLDLQTAVALLQIPLRQTDRQLPAGRHLVVPQLFSPLDSMAVTAV